MSKTFYHSFIVARHVTRVNLYELKGSALHLYLQRHRLKSTCFSPCSSRKRAPDFLKRRGNHFAWRNHAALFQFQFEGDTRRRRASDEDSAFITARSERGSQRSSTDKVKLELHLTFSTGLPALNSRCQLQFDFLPGPSRQCDQHVQAELFELAADQVGHA